VLDRVEHCRFVIDGQDRNGGWCRFLESHSQEYGWQPEPHYPSTGHCAKGRYHSLLRLRQEYRYETD
jgi:hypothetical protein